MAEARQQLECAGLQVRSRWPAPAATLRYFSASGDFGQRLQAAGLALPASGRVHAAESGLVLAWRSPSETLCLAPSERVLAELARHLAGAPGGCLVELTGALTLIELEGARTKDLLVRLGGSAPAPVAGESRRSRMADVPVLALSPLPAQTWLVVERALAEHLWAWISETLLDFA